MISQLVFGVQKALVAATVGFINIIIIIKCNFYNLPTFVCFN